MASEIANGSLETNRLDINKTVRLLFSEVYVFNTMEDEGLESETTSPVGTAPEVVDTDL